MISFWLWRNLWFFLRGGGTDSWTKIIQDQSSDVWEFISFPPWLAESKQVLTQWLVTGGNMWLVYLIPSAKKVPHNFSVIEENCFSPTPAYRYFFSDNLVQDWIQYMILFLSAKKVAVCIIYFSEEAKEGIIF